LERETGLAESNNFSSPALTQCAESALGDCGRPGSGAVQYAAGRAKRTLFNPKMNKMSPRIGGAYQLNAKTRFAAVRYFLGPTKLLQLTVPFRRRTATPFVASTTVT